MERLRWVAMGVLTLCGMAFAVSAAKAVEGPPAHAAVSFGQWDPNDPDLLPAEMPLDRLLVDPPAGRGNHHALIPNIVTIQQGGSVRFVVSGGHVINVYDDGHRPEDVNTTNIELATSCPTTAGGVLSDANRRIYRGPCFAPATNNTTPHVRRDGVEVVRFAKPGTYLVICARKNHFVNDGMFGYVRVVPGKPS